MEWQLLWPEALISALAVPGVLWLYVRLERHRRSSEPTLSTLRSAEYSGRWHRWIAQHIPAILMLCSLALLCLALARPMSSLTLKPVRGQVVIAIDVSKSMRAVDAPPSRLHAAKRLARQLVVDHSDVLRIGLVSFAGTAIIDSDFDAGREELLAAIDRLSTRPGTSLGLGIRQALDMLLPQFGTQRLARKIEEYDGESLPTSRITADALHPGSRGSVAIVLLTDGQSAMGPTPIAAARVAAHLGVRVHAVGIGTSEGSVLREHGWSMRVQREEAPLAEIAKLTAATYTPAEHRVDWHRIVAAVRSDGAVERSLTEATGLIAALAALLAIIGWTWSIVRTQRVL